MKKNLLSTSLALAWMACAAQALAQSATPLQGPVPPQPQPLGAGTPPVVPPPGAAKPAPTGPGVVLKKIDLSGNTLLNITNLLGALGDVTGQPYNMAGLNALAAGIENQYRLSGYPFTQAFLPPQDLKDGTLKIQVIEGRYGSIRAAGKDGLPAAAQPFLDFGLKSGTPIESKALERTLLILDDQPGMKIRPIIQPGKSLGEADLQVNVERSSWVSGEAGFDNIGSRSTGEYRARAALFINSPFQYGDKISLNGLYTDEHMWLGSIDYETPLGPSGLRGQIGFARTNYQLGAQFASLDAKGYANVSSARLSYPVIRSQASNVLLSLGYQHKDLEDRYDATATIRNKKSDLIPVAVQFDKRDALWGGGVIYGSLTWLFGQLKLDPTTAATDRLTAKSEGHFDKLNLDIARIQSMSGNFSAYARYSGQWAGKNLDSSEKFNLGGFYGVRAYPLGEGVGDQGWFSQLEMRYAMGSLTPFLFHDMGNTDTNAEPWDANSTGSRKLGGTGLGVRSLYDNWSADATLAVRTEGGRATSDDVDRNPRFFFMVGRRF